MSNLHIEQLPAPQPCALCGRPTTRYSPELRIAFCGREERPEEWAGATGEFAPTMRGGGRQHGGGRRRRGLGRRQE